MAGQVARKDVLFRMNGGHGRSYAGWTGNHCFSFHNTLSIICLRWLGYFLVTTGNRTGIARDKNCSMTDASSRLIDETLVLEAQAGNARAVDLLVARWQGRLHAYAKRLLGRDDDAAWDACQDAWVGIAKGLPKLNDPAAFAAWAYRIVTNKCRDHIRRQVRQKELHERLARENGSSVTGGTGSLELKEAFERLSPDMQAVLTLHYFEHFAVVEIADILGIAEGTVKSRLHRARAQLKKLMET